MGRIRWSSLSEFPPDCVPPRSRPSACRSRCRNTEPRPRGRSARTRSYLPILARRSRRERGYRGSSPTDGPERKHVVEGNDVATRVEERVRRGVKNKNKKKN